MCSQVFKAHVPAYAINPSRAWLFVLAVCCSQSHVLYACHSADIKFLTADKAFTPKGLKDDTPYTVMFGADKCGDTNKVRAACTLLRLLVWCCGLLDCRQCAAGDLLVCCRVRFQEKVC